MKRYRKYRKFIVALAGVLVILGKTLADGTISADELGALVVAVATAAGVYAAPNEPTDPALNKASEP